MEINERILSIVKGKGPILPVQISKEINDNILMTSARLSELLSSKKIKISNIKVGGSPLYYVNGQESKLQNYSDNLPNKEKEAFNLLKQNKILRDLTQEPAIRVALRQIKDFAIPLQVNYENKVEAFWKWYLADKNEAESLIREALSKKDEIKKKEIAEYAKEAKETIQKKEEPISTKKLKEKPIDQNQYDKINFIKKINNYFNKNRINIIETNEVKKNSEIDFIIELQTTIGNVKYFCKSKNKKKINESDLSMAVIQAQSKGLPLLFLTNGKLAKKSEDKLNTDLKNIVYREI